MFESVCCDSKFFFTYAVKSEIIIDLHVHHYSPWGQCLVNLELRLDEQTNRQGKLLSGFLMVIQVNLSEIIQE